MPAYSERRHSPYSPKQLFALVADVERYPEFLPWCRAARVLNRKENEFIAELVISFKHLTESYVSRVSLEPPEGARAPCAINVEMISGPFEYLRNEWRFIPANTSTVLSANEVHPLPTPPPPAGREEAVCEADNSSSGSNGKAVKGGGGALDSVGTIINFSVDFKFRSRLLEGLIGGLFGRAAAKMGEAFAARAAALYGNTP